MKKHFLNEAHIEPAGTGILENRNCISKQGKRADDPKVDTSIPVTFEELCPPSEEPGQGARTDVYQQIVEGLSNAEIMA